MTIKTDAPDKASKQTLPSLALDRTDGIGRARATCPSPGNLFSGVDVAASEADGKAQLYYLRDFSTPSLLIEQSLTRARYQVCHLQEPDRLVDACAAGRADVVVIDHSLPLAERLTLIKDIRDKHPTVPIILVFKPGGEDRDLVDEMEALAECVTRDRDGAYLFKIPDIADRFMREHEQHVVAPRSTPRTPRKDSSERRKLSSPDETVHRAVLGSSEPALVVLAGPDVGAVIPLTESLVLIGRDPSCHLQLKDESVSRFHVSIKPGSGGRLIIRDLDSTNGTFIRGALIEKDEIKEGDKVLLGNHTLLKYQKQDVADPSYLDDLYDAATRDGLTGICNRRACLERITIALSFAKRHILPVSLILFSIDDFAHVIDTHGHTAGDLAVAATARAVVSKVRVEDVFGRFDNEKFVVFALDTDLMGAQIIANRIREEVALNAIVGSESMRDYFRVTVSLGIASTATPRCCDTTRLITRADANFLNTKENGKNGIVSSEILE